MNQPSFNNTASTNEHGLSQFYARIYGYLGIGIALSALSSFLMMNVFYEQFIGMLTQSRFSFLMLWVAEIALVIYLGRKATTNPTMALAGFIAYSLLNGVTISVTLALYSQASVTKGFIAAALTFGSMAILGATTKKDLSAMGQALRSMLIGLIVVILVNGFILQSSAADLFISIVMVAVFAGLTAYDHQMIRRYYDQVQGDEATLKGLAVFCALQLYLDFINLLLAFIRIFGRD